MTAFAILVVAVVSLALSIAKITKEQQLTAAAARMSQREVLLQQIVHIFSSLHNYGWSEQIGKLVLEATQLGPGKDHRLQGYAAASLGGLDARLIEKVPILAATIRFDPSGQALYLSDANGRNWVWNRSDTSLWETGTPGVGMFAFRPDGTALQLCFATDVRPDKIDLRALEPARIVRTFASPLGPGSRIAAITLTPDAGLIGATIVTKENRGLAVVWDGQTGRIVGQFRKKRDRLV